MPSSRRPPSRTPKKAEQVPVRFEGFADTSGRFFQQLAKNQNRDWFQAHKHEYDVGWARPMQALMTELRERLDPLFPLHPLAAPKVFRIYRDVRFSADKAPYKTHIGGYISLDGGSGGPSTPGPLYVHVGATETFVAAGHYMMDGPQLARFRAALLDDAAGGPLAKTLAGLTRRGYGISAYETLKKVPRGVDPEHPRAALLKQKGLILTFPDLPRHLLVERKLVDWLLKHAKPVVPVVEWLANLGE